MAVKNSNGATSSSIKAESASAPVLSSPAEGGSAVNEAALANAGAAKVEAPVKPEPTPAAPVVAKVATPAAVATPVKAKRASARKAAPKKIAPAKAPVKAVVKTVRAKLAKPIVHAAKAVVTPAVEAAETVQKEIKIMATKFEMPKFEAPKVFADMNDKTKAAMEKSTKLVEEFNEFAKGNVEAIVESGKIAAKGLETLGQEVADYNRKSFDGLTTTMKSFASVKSPTDFFKLQSDYVRSAFDAAVAQGSKNTEAMIKLAGDAAQPLSNRFAVAAEKVKAAA